MKNLVNKIFDTIKAHKATSIAVAGVVVAAAIAIPIGVFAGSDDDPVNTANSSKVESPVVSEPSTPSEPSETINSEEKGTEAYKPNLTESVSSEADTTSEKPDTAPDHKHSYTIKTVKPTCTKGGYTLHTCSCGKSYKDNKTSMLGHSYGDWVVVKNATTTSTGKKECKCSTCGNKITETIPKRAMAYNNVDKSLQIEREKAGPIMITRFYNDNCRVVDTRTWGNPPTITVTSNGGLHTIYYDKNNQKVEFTVEPIKGYINGFTIREDGTYVSMITGSYS